MIKIIFIFLFFLIVQSCAPLVGLVGVASIGSSQKEKGLGTSITDTLIHSKIASGFYKYDPDITIKTKVFVNAGSVVITGRLSKPIKKIELTKIAWAVRGVKEVNNEIQITDKSSLKNLARDIASMGEINVRLMTDKNINSLNFSIDVLNDKAYLTGIAKDKEEMKRVKDYANNAKFIKEVINYIIINNDTR